MNGQEDSAVQAISSTILDFFNKEQVPPNTAVDALCTALAVVLATSTDRTGAKKTCKTISEQLLVAIKSVKMEQNNGQKTH